MVVTVTVPVPSIDALPLYLSTAAETRRVNGVLGGGMHKQKKKYHHRGSKGSVGLVIAMA